MQLAPVFAALRVSRWLCAAWGEGQPGRGLEKDVDSQSSWEQMYPVKGIKTERQQWPHLTPVMPQILHNSVLSRPSLPTPPQFSFETGLSMYVARVDLELMIFHAQSLSARVK